MKKEDMNPQPISPAFTIQEIEASDCYGLRQSVLRPNDPIEEAIFPEDQIEGTFHLGAFDQANQLICIASFTPQKYAEAHPDFQCKNPFRLRGMATHPEAQGRGIGAALMGRALQEIQRLQGELLWCHARTSARGFYEKLGLKIHGSEFLNPRGIPHFVMWRPIEGSH